MKKKISFKLGLFCITVLLCINGFMATDICSKGISLNDVIFCNQALAESGDTQCQNGQYCEDANDLQYGTKTDGAGGEICCGQAVTKRGRKKS